MLFTTNSGVWHFGAGRDRGGLHERHDPPPPRADPLPDQLPRRQEGPREVHHVLDPESLRPLGGGSAT